MLRLVNITSVILFAYTLAVAAYLIPYGWVGAILLLVRICRRPAQRLAGYGQSRWAEFRDVKHLRSGPGVVIGFMGGRIGRMDGLKALFTQRDGARIFLESCKGRYR